MVTRKRLLGLLAVIWITGCQTVPYQGQAHDIKRKPQEEGIVGIPLNPRDEDRAKAEQKMASNCGAGQYKVVEEGEVAVGQETKSTGKETDRASTQKKVGSLFGLPLTTGEAGGTDHESSQVVSSVKEWQISYKCMTQNGAPEKKKVR